MDVFIINNGLFGVGALKIPCHSSFISLRLAFNRGTTHVSKRVFAQHSCKSSLQLCEPLGIIRAVKVEHGETHERNECKHVKDGEHDIEVRVDTIPQPQEWLVLQLSLTLWHSYLHLLEQCFSQSISEIWLTSLSAFPEWLQEGEDVIHLS